MSRTSSPGQYQVPILSTGEPATRTGARGIYTLAAGTYYVDLGGLQATHLSAHFQWSAALAATITFWGSDFAEADAPLISTTVADWIQEDPVTAYVPVVGTGNSVANMTITAGGSNAGGARVNISVLAAARVRARIVVTTGGTIRVARFGKL